MYRFPPLDKRDKNTAFKEERIPYSQFFDLDKVADLSKPKPHTFPSNEIFIEHMKKMDIRKSDTIILYDRTNVFSSPRGFLTFKWFGANDVKILNGGFPRYQQLKGEVEKGDSFNVEKINEYRKNHVPIKEDDFNYILESNRVYNIEKVYENKNNAFLIDARSEERYEGKAQEPRKCLRVGHINGALNLFFKHLLDESGRYKSNEEIEALFKKIGVEGEKDIIGYCGSGLTACIVLFSLCLIGKEKYLRLYDGSWFEYGTIPEEELKKLEEKYRK